MKAVILAGGKGTRLAPFTTVFPKPLVPIGTKPIIEIIVRQLAHHGFNEVVMTTGYLAELIQSYFATTDMESNVNLSYVRETKPTGTAGSLSLIDGLDDSFLVMNGDVLTSMNYMKFAKYHKENGGILTIAIHQKTVKVELGVIELDGSRLITEYIEKPEKHFNVSMGVYMYEPEALEYIPEGKYFDFPDLVLKLLENKKRVIGYLCEDYWMDIGNHEDYAKVQENMDMIDREIIRPIFP